MRKLYKLSFYVEVEGKYNRSIKSFIKYTYKSLEDKECVDVMFTSNNFDEIWEYFNKEIVLGVFSYKSFGKKKISIDYNTCQEKDISKVSVFYKYEETDTEDITMERLFKSLPPEEFMYFWLDKTYGYNNMENMGIGD